MILRLHMLRIGGREKNLFPRLPRLLGIKGEGWMMDQNVWSTCETKPFSDDVLKKTSFHGICFTLGRQSLPNLLL